MINLTSKFPFSLSKNEEKLILKRYPRQSQALEEFKLFVDKLFSGVLYQKSVQQCIQILHPKVLNLPNTPKVFKLPDDLTVLQDTSLTTLIHLLMLIFDDFLTKKMKSARLKMSATRESLPIYEFKQEIVNQVKTNQVVLIAADTGAGKSTQVPQYLLEAGFKNIACTQPRRIACFSLAKRVSQETMNMYGSEIAYQVRFDKNKTSATKVLFLTEGVLLRNLTNDPDLAMYDLIIVDEVHERHITGKGIGISLLSSNCNEGSTHN